MTLTHDLPLPGQWVTLPDLQPVPGPGHPVFDGFAREVAVRAPTRCEHPVEVPVWFTRDPDRLCCPACLAVPLEVAVIVPGRCDGCGGGPVEAIVSAVLYPTCGFVALLCAPCMVRGQ